MPTSSSQRFRLKMFFRRLLFYKKNEQNVYTAKMPVHNDAGGVRHEDNPCKRYDTYRTSI